MPSIAYGQFWREMMNPKISVTIKHPPKYSMALEKIVFAPPTGPCSGEIVTELTSDFIDNDIEVLNRDDLDLIMQELNFASESSYVDKTTAVAIGQHLGPSALISVLVTRCDSRQSQTTRTETRRTKEGKTYKVKVYQANTDFYFKMALNVTNLATGVTYAAEQIGSRASRTNESEEDYPAHPDEFDIHEFALQEASNQVSKLLFPWTEKRELTFFNSSKGSCDLKPAHTALEAGDSEHAFELSKQNIETCINENKAQENIKSNAYYNAGVMYRVHGEFDAALEHLRKAAELKPGANLVITAMKEAREAQAASVAMLNLKEETDLRLKELQAQAAKAVESQAQSTVTNEDIIKMVSKKLPELILLKQIEISDCKFDLSPDGLIGLVEAGVPENVITAMMEKK